MPSVACIIVLIRHGAAPIFQDWDPGMGYKGGRSDRSPERCGLTKPSAQRSRFGSVTVLCQHVQVTPKTQPNSIAVSWQALAFSIEVARKALALTITITLTLTVAVGGTLVQYIPFTACTSSFVLLYPFPAFACGLYPMLRMWCGAIGHVAYVLPSKGWFI